MPRIRGFDDRHVRQREHLENALGLLARMELDLKLVQLRVQQAQKRAGLHDLLNPADEIVIQTLDRIGKYRNEIDQALSLLNLTN